MRMPIGTVIALFAGALNLGCQPAATPQAAAPAARASQAAAVAVVDLDQIAKRLGRDLDMNRSIEQASTSLNEQLQSIRDKLQSQYDEKLRATATSDDEAVRPASTGAAGPESDQPAALKRQLQQQLNQYELQAREKLAQHRAAVIERFRREVRPVAERVASARGAGIVVTKNDTVVFAVVPEADITEDVVKEMQRAASAPSGGSTSASEPASADDSSRSAPASNSRR